MKQLAIPIWSSFMLEFLTDETLANNIMKDSLIESAHSSFAISDSIIAILWRIRENE